MKTVSVSAHFDGEHIQLDEPLDLAPNAKLIVTVLSGQDHERASWEALSLQSLSNAYGGDEEEYSLRDVKELNPDYDRR